MAPFGVDAILAAHDEHVKARHRHHEHHRKIAEESKAARAAGADDPKANPGEQGASVHRG